MPMLVTPVGAVSPPMVVGGVVVVSTRVVGGVDVVIGATNGIEELPTDVLFEGVEIMGGRDVGSDVTGSEVMVPGSVEGTALVVELGEIEILPPLVMGGTELVELDDTGGMTEVITEVGAEDTPVPPVLMEEGTVTDSEVELTIPVPGPVGVETSCSVELEVIRVGSCV